MDRGDSGAAGIAVAEPLRPMAARNRELDGMRGWAALGVIGQHLVGNVFGSYVPELNQLPGFFRHGDLSVMVFFALSGDALSSKFLANLDTGGVARLALRRYFRLVGIIVFTCALMFVLLIAGLAPHAEAAAAINNESWFSTALGFNPSVLHLLWYSFIGVFTQTGFTPDNSYNPFLWTMNYELVGSFLIFGYMFLYPRLRFKAWSTVVALVLSALVNPFAPLFFLGMLIGIARSRGLLDRQLNNPIWQVAALVFFVGFGFYDSYGPTLGKGLLGLTGGFLVWCVCSSRLLKRAFTSRLSLFLGDISFPLYAIQFPIMMSPMALAILFAQRQGLLNTWTALLIMVLSLALMIGAAYFIERGERRYLRVVARVADRLLIPPPGAATPGSRPGA